MTEVKVKEIVWGAEIETPDGRPKWLRDNDLCEPHWHRTGWFRDDVKVKHVHGWEGINLIRLPADHWAYIAINAGMEPWAGGDSAPDDWDGERVILRDGREWRGSVWDHEGIGSDIVGYHKKKTGLPEVPADATMKFEMGFEDLPKDDAPNDMALETARLYAYEGTTKWVGELEYIKKNPKESFCRVVVELARMIQAYEPHRILIDPDVIAVREILAGWFNQRDRSVKEQIELGNFDASPEFATALAAYKKAKS